MKFVNLVGLLIVAGLAFGCARTQIVNFSATKIYVFVDSGTSQETDQKRIDARNDVAQYMEVYLNKKFLRRNPFIVEITKSKEDLLLQNGQYLLCVYMDEYHRGSPQGTIVNWFNRTTMNVRYELIDSQKNALISEDMDHKSGKGWQKSVEEVGSKIDREVRRTLTQLNARQLVRT